MKRKCAHPHLCKAEELGTILSCRQGKKIKKKNKRKERRSKGRNGGRFLPGTKPVSEKGEFPLKSFFLPACSFPFLCRCLVSLMAHTTDLGSWLFSAPFLFLPKVPSVLSFSFLASPALIIFSLLLLLMNCSGFSYLWGPAASWGARLESCISHPSQSLRKTIVSDEDIH